MTRALAADLATAANPARGGLVREALGAHFPRLAQLLEDALGRLARDTQARRYSHDQGLGCRAEFGRAWAAHFPRLAQLLEDALGRLARDTQARPRSYQGLGFSA